MPIRRLTVLILMFSISFSLIGLPDPLPAGAENKEMEDLTLIPGGDSIGIELSTNGIVIMGKNPDAETGAKNMKQGDVIKKANGHSLSNVQQLTSLIQKAGKKKEPLTLQVTRGKSSFETDVTPYKNEGTDYAIGLYVKDKISGIGTLTFSDPENREFGALGHIIQEPGMKDKREVDEGTLMRSTVTSIRRGKEGLPGEKHAEFNTASDKIGVVSINSSFGIFGQLDESLSDEEKRKALPVKPAEEVEEGPAVIRTVVEGETIEEYDIEIVENRPESDASTKGMVIKITDERLLDQTGGIVQGMSGSPIIQDDHIVGAVTHVFVNDAASGYGVHIEWMVEEMRKK